MPPSPLPFRPFFSLPLLVAPFSRPLPQEHPRFVLAPSASYCCHLGFAPRVTGTGCGVDEQHRGRVRLCATTFAGIGVCVCVSALPLECNVECVGVRHVPPNARLGFASVDIPEAELEVRAAAVCAAVCAFRHTVHTTLGVMLCRCQLRLSTYRRHLCGWTDSTVRGHGCWTASPCTHPEAYLIRSCPCSLLTVHRRSKPVVS